MVTNSQKNISTISYFDVNQKNGGAIFAKNLDRFLNGTGLFTSKIYYNDRSSAVENTANRESKKEITITSNFKNRIKTYLRKNKSFELIIYFLRNDLNALILALKLFLKGSVNRNNIHLFHDHLSLFYFSLFFSLKKRKVVLIMHNDGSPIEMITLSIQNNRKRKFLIKVLNFQMRCCLKNVDKVVFLCENARNKFLKSYKAVDFSSTIAIPNGIKPLVQEDISQNNNDSVIKFITVCTLNERKGIDFLMNCIPEINKNYASKVSFTIAGQGPLIEELREIAEIHKNVHVLGESGSISKLLNQADVFFLLSRTEGQPISLLEALRASLAILATDVGCNSAMVNPHNGILVEVDQTSILNGFQTIIKDWEKYNKKGLNSYRLFNDTFTEDKMYHSYLNLFRSLY